MALDKKTLEELKAKLLAEKIRIEGELGVIAKPLAGEGSYETTFNEIGTDEDENASEVEEYADNLALENTLQKQLKEITEALDRMAAGTYGKCENCGQEIDVDRLRAYPAARTCITC